MNINIEDFCDINSAILSLPNGCNGRIFIQSSITISAPVTVPLNVTIEGVGSGAAIRPSQAMDKMFILSGIGSKIKNLQILNDQGFADDAIHITSPLFSSVESVYISGFSKGVYVDGAQGFSVRNCQLISNGDNVYLANDGRNSLITGNHMEAGNGITVNKTTIQAEGLIISDNVILPSTTEGTIGAGIVINNGMEIRISGNTIDNSDDNCIKINQASYISISDNWLGGNISNGASNGVLVNSPSNNIDITQNRICGCGGAGININHLGGTISSSINILGNRFLECGIFDMVVSSAIFTIIKDNHFTHTSYPLLESGAECIVENNRFSVQPIKSLLSHYKNNWIAQTFTE